MLQGLWFAAIVGLLNNPLSLQDKMNAFLLPPETYQRYAQKTLGTKTVLSRGVTGKTYCVTFPFSDRGQRKKKTEIKLSPGFATGSPVIKPAQWRYTDKEDLRTIVNTSGSPCFASFSWRYADCQWQVLLRRSNLFSRFIGGGNWFNTILLDFSYKYF